uniref:Uncharacterized protein n=1 Tax=Mycena chlorophos TaxID=658473 RepID=A0ABQ0L2G9_MYCCL|nr:predicted protein [Mycena chlorophos]
MAVIDSESLLQTKKQMDDLMKMFPNGFPRTHAYLHLDTAPRMFNLLPGVGTVDGEGIERAWVEAALSLISVPHPSLGSVQINAFILQKRIIDLVLMHRLLPPSPPDLQMHRLLPPPDLQRGERRTRSGSYMPQPYFEPAARVEVPAPTPDEGEPITAHIDDCVEEDVLADVIPFSRREMTWSLAAAALSFVRKTLGFSKTVKREKLWVSQLSNYAYIEPLWL